MSTREADMLFRLEMSFDLFAYINKLDEGINLSTEIAELVPYRICRLNKQSDSICEKLFCDNRVELIRD